MTLVFQNPASGTSLISALGTATATAKKGAGAFAFASAAGVRLLAAEPNVRLFFSNYSFDLVIGLDAITDVKAVSALEALKALFPKLKIQFFSHDQQSTLFHPKLIWLRTNVGGFLIAGSGNLTVGGLKGNWEAYASEQLNESEIQAVEMLWSNWCTEHRQNLKEFYDPIVLEKANANAAVRSKLAKAAKLQDDTEQEIEYLIEALAETVESNPVLIAEIPRNGDRIKQVNFDVKSYKQFFGVTLGQPRSVVFYPVSNTGELQAPETRPAVSVKSKNYRFEIGAAANLAYPENGIPVLVFERVSEDNYKYILLMPGEEGHSLIETFLNTNYPTNHKLRRIIVTSDEFSSIWPLSPLSVA